MRTMHLAAALFAAATIGVAQSTHVIPNGLATTPGNTSNNFPWANASAWPGLHHQGMYDSANFTAAGINYPILITSLRWRAAPTANSWAGGTITQAAVRMSTAPYDYTAISTAMASNLGADAALVHNGPVTYIGGTGNGLGVVGPVVVDLPLQSPFVYDPNSGDLVIDVDYVGAASTGLVTTSLDVQSTGSLSSRAFASTTYPTANGTTMDHGVVVEMTYTRVQQLTTHYTGTNGNSNGGGVYFDLEVHSAEGVRIDGLGLNSSDTGLTGAVDVYVRRGTAVGFEASAAGWTQVVAAAPVISAGIGLPSRTSFPPFILPPGTHGIAIAVTGTGFAYGQRYTTGGGSFGDGCLTVTAGSANNTLFTAGVNSPRTWNGTIYYERAGRQVDAGWNGSTSIAGANPGMFFDTFVRPAGGVRVTSFEVNGIVATPADTISIWTRTGTAVGNTGSTAGWRQVANALPFVNLGTGLRSQVNLPVPIFLGAGTNGIAMALGSGSFRYTVGASTATDGIVDVIGHASAAPMFSASIIVNRSWNGIVHYQIVDPDVAQLQFNEPFGTTVGNSAVGTSIATSGLVNTANWQGDPGRAAFRGNEPGAGMLANAGTTNTNLVTMGWPVPLTGNMTIMWWQRMGATTPPSTAYSCGSSSGSERIFTGGVAGTSLWYRGSPIGDIRANANVQANPGVWQHVAVVIDDDNGVAHWYIDGALDSTQTFTPHTHVVNGTTWRVGYSTSTTSTFTAYYDMDDYRLFNQALTEAEVKFAREGENPSAGVYGNGCGLGRIAAVGGQPSATSGNPNFGAQVLGANAGQLFVNIMGFTPRATGPVNVAPFFGPGCVLNTPNSGSRIGVTNGAGNGGVALPIPRNPALVGLHAYTQFIVWPFGAGTTTEGVDINLK